MSNLSDLIEVSSSERPFVDFESSLDNDEVVSGYVPVKSTIDLLDFLNESLALHSPRGRAVVCWGAYGSGKSRLCSVIARLFRDGIDCPALTPVWKRFEARGQVHKIEELRKSFMPGSRSWRPWLVVPMYASAGAGNLSAALVRALTKALQRAGLGSEILRTTVYQEAAKRLRDIGGSYVPASGSPFSTMEMLARAMEKDLDEAAYKEFCEFHKKVTFGVSFPEFIQTVGGVSIEANEVYREAASNLQQHGYDGIVVIWDEMGFAIEQLLKGARDGARNLGQEAMALQDFIEKACGLNEYGKRIIFIGFTHVGLTEYGSRANLDVQDQNRLVTVADRFRQPNINIRLSVTETEGYHLVAGMMRRTALGDNLFHNPIPRLQKLADRMPKLSEAWHTLSVEACYNDIAAACYPFHPATVMVLLQLSDLIAQQSRTTFYYLQDKQEGGLAGILNQRIVPQVQDMGSAELVRIFDLFHFFEEPIKARERRFFEEYEGGLAHFPNPSPLELGILRAVLILKTARIPPTTTFLAFALTDALRSEPHAKPLHDALERLSNVGSLWHNAASDVWSFSGTSVARSEVDREIEDELDAVPDRPGTLLFRAHPEIHSEVADFLGDFDLDPGESGIVRRLSIKVLDIAQGPSAVEKVNPATNGDGSEWRSAIVYLVLPDTQQVLDFWKQQAARSEQQNVYFVFPQGPVDLGPQVRDLIAVRQVLAKKDTNDHAYKVLEGKLTKLRQDLRHQFALTYGNAGLLAGTTIVQSGPELHEVAVESWNELLPSLGTALDAEFEKQIKVRCGAFNAWQDRASWGAISHIVERVLDFDKEKSELQDEFLGFKDTSQEAAIVDGVLFENNYFRANALSGQWDFAPIDEMDNAVQEIAKHIQGGGSTDKEFEKLFVKLIDPPYGIPNAIIPLLLAIVVRSDVARIGIYQRASGGQLARRTDTADAIVEMAKQPSRFVTRYNKLTGKQRLVFKAVGPEVGVPFSDRDDRGEAFYEYCARARDQLIAWTSRLTEDAVIGSGVSDAQRKLLKMLRNPVPPQISLLADALLAVIGEDPATHEELGAADSSTREFPSTVQAWRKFKEDIDRHVDGVKATLRRQITELVGVASPQNPVSDRLVNALKPMSSQVGTGDPISRMVEKLSANHDQSDLALEIASAIANKELTKLTSEDFGIAAGVLKMVGVVKEMQRRCSVVLSSGVRRELNHFSSPGAETQIREVVGKLRSTFGFSDDEFAYLILHAIYAAEAPPSNTMAAEHPAGGTAIGQDETLPTSASPES